MSKSGVLLEAETQVPAPIYSENNTPPLPKLGLWVGRYKIKSQTNQNFFSLLSCLARQVYPGIAPLNSSSFLREN